MLAFHVFTEDSDGDQEEMVVLLHEIQDYLLGKMTYEDRYTHVRQPVSTRPTSKVRLIEVRETI